MCVSIGGGRLAFSSPAEATVDPFVVAHGSVWTTRSCRGVRWILLAYSPDPDIEAPQNGSPPWIALAAGRYRRRRRITRAQTQGCSRSSRRVDREPRARRRAPRAGRPTGGPALSPGASAISCVWVIRSRHLACDLRYASEQSSGADLNPRNRHGANNADQRTQNASNGTQIGTNGWALST